MLLALLLSLVVWSSPPPQLYVCRPPGPIVPTNCERVHFEVLGKFPAP